MFLGSGLFPLTYPGIDDRIQTFAAFGFVLVAYSVLALAGHLVGRKHGRTGVVIVAAGTILIGVGFIQRVRNDVSAYDSAAAEQRSFLQQLQIVLPHPEPGSTVFTFGYPAETAPGVPIFQGTSDLRGAVDLRWNERSLRAVPIYLQNVLCSRSTISAHRFGAPSAAAYGHAVFVDVPTGRTRHIGSPGACVRARKVFKPGHLFPNIRS
jgi:hypothetical protein